MIQYPIRYTLIEWLDSRGSTDRWARLDDLRDNDCCKMISVGWIIIENDTEVHVAPHIGVEDEIEDAQFSGVMVIPKISITRRAQLTEV